MASADEHRRNAGAIVVLACCLVQVLAALCLASCDARSTKADCEPLCTGKQCGEDGCGGECGPGCATGLRCEAGMCIAGCVPACGEKQCGPDGCGGECGPGCGAGFHCEAGECIVDCAPACGGKQCGPDGCGGECGPGCATGLHCTDAGACAADCTPGCTGMRCGSDGCGGTCACAAGTFCSQSKSCVPPSINCPPGQQCTYDEYAAHRYVCTESASGSFCTSDGRCWDCTPDAADPYYHDGFYGSVGECQDAGCRDGQFGCLECYSREGCTADWTPVTVSCLLCDQNCKTAETSRLCPAIPPCEPLADGRYPCVHEVAPIPEYASLGGCMLWDEYGPYMANCVCR